MAIAVNGDPLNEPDETFVVNLSKPVNAVIVDAQAIVTIQNDDPTPGLSIADATVTEGNSGTVDANFVVTLSAASSQSITVQYATADGTALQPADYLAASGTLNFSAGDTSKTITVKVAGDYLDELDETFLVKLSGPTNATLARGQAPGTIRDDDTAGITVSPTSGLVTTEAGGKATFSVVLTSQPAASVTIPISSSDTTEGVVSPASLTFTPGNWSVAQTVSVTGVDDAVQDGDVSYSIVTGSAASSDPGYNGMNAADVSVINTDDDMAGISVSPTSGLVTSEGGGSASFTVVLRSQPTANVVIGLSSSDTTEGTVNPGSLTFTPANWSAGADGDGQGS